MSLLDDLKQLQAQAQAELEKVASPERLEAWRIKYLGLKGQVKTALARLKKSARGKTSRRQGRNDLKNLLQGAFDSLASRLALPRQTAGPWWTSRCQAAARNWATCTS